MNSYLKIVALTLAMACTAIPVAQAQDVDLSILETLDNNDDGNNTREVAYGCYIKSWIKTEPLVSCYAVVCEIIIASAVIFTRSWSGGGSGGRGWRGRGSWADDRR